MNVYDVAVTFGCTVQPKEYESAKAEVSYKIALDEGEGQDHAAVTDEMMQHAKAHVFHALGLGPKHESPTAEKPKATRKPRQTKAQKEAEKEAADDNEAEDDGIPGDSEDTATTDKAIDFAELRKRTKVAAEKHGGAKIKEVIEKHLKVISLQKIPEDRRAEFLRIIEADKIEIPTDG